MPQKPHLAQAKGGAKRGASHSGAARRDKVNICFVVEIGSRFIFKIRALLFKKCDHALLLKVNGLQNWNFISLRCGSPTNWRMAGSGRRWTWRGRRGAQSSGPTTRGAGRLSASIASLGPMKAMGFRRSCRSSPSQWRHARGCRHDFLFV